MGAAILAGLVGASQASAGALAVTPGYNGPGAPVDWYSVGYSDSITGALPSEGGAVNDITAGASGMTVTIRDRGQVILPDPLAAVDVLRSCSLRVDTAICRPPGAGLSLAQATFALGAGADRLAFGPQGDLWIPLAVTAGPGNDTLTGGPDPDSLDGAAGNDVVSGGGGGDLLEYPPASYYTSARSPGADRLDPGPGRDQVGALDDGDFVTARDGESDRVICGGSQATVLADPSDVLVDCPNAQVD